MDEPAVPPVATFLGATGEMAERMARHDWSTTSLGAPEQWPLSLKTAVRIVLRSRFAMAGLGR